MVNFLKGSNGVLHDRDFLGPIEYFLDGDGLCIPSINDTLIILYWNKDILVVKDRPIHFDERVDTIAYGRFQMGQVKILL
jgi:hypothetical protein